MPPLRLRFSALPPIASDSALTLLAAVFAAVHLVVVRGHGAPPRPWSILLALLCASALLVRSRWPIGTLLAVGVLGTLSVLIGDVELFALLPTVLIALYSAVAYSTRPRWQVWALGIGVSVALELVTLPSDRDLSAHITGVLLNGGWMTMALLLGEALRSRHAFAQEAELRAIQAEQTQREVAQRRVSEERLQMARELHDILAHTVALINVQAGVAAHVINQHPEQAREALNHIKTASHATLQELRSLVGVVREAGGSVPLAPAPGLDALDELVHTVRDAGLDVDLDVDPSNGQLPATVDLAVYRILQEALTNVIKHAGPSSVQVSVHRGGRQLMMKVINSAGTRPPGLSGEGAGQGIAGMRERAAVLGGTLQAGPLPGGGFQVSATLPLQGEAA